VLAGAKVTIHNPTYEISNKIEPMTPSFTSSTSTSSHGIGGVPDSVTASVGNAPFAGLEIPVWDIRLHGRDPLVGGGHSDVWRAHLMRDGASTLVSFPDYSSVCLSTNLRVPPGRSEGLASQRQDPGRSERGMCDQVVLLIDSLPWESCLCRASSMRSRARESFIMETLPRYLVSALTVTADHPHLFRPGTKTARPPSTSRVILLQTSSP
jgi:hypothetical protein